MCFWTQEVNCKATKIVVLEGNILITLWFSYYNNTQSFGNEKIN